MPPELSVDPGELRSAGATFAKVGSAISALKPGLALADLSTALQGFQSGPAGAYVGTLLDATYANIGREVGTYASNLSSAAQKYDQTDREAAEKIKTRGFRK